MKNNNLEYINKHADIIKKKKILCFLLAMTLALNAISSTVTKKSNKKNDIVYSTTIEDYTLEDIHRFIYSSPYLTDLEKDYLYNEEFLTDFLNCINNSYYLKYKYQFHFHDIKILTYGEENPMYENNSGYYSRSNPEVLNIKDYTGFDDKYKNTISHEFIHLCQDTSGYNLIIEACAEIISYEYYDDAYNDVYITQVCLLKKLMEIIGTDVIWYYNFTGDFSQIEMSVKPYLTEKEYASFLNDLTFDYINTEENKIKFEELDMLLGKLYKNIYGTDIKDNEVISLIDKHQLFVVRYYFNHRFNESYYIDYLQGEYKSMSYEEAINDNVVHVFAHSSTPITYEEALEYIENGKDIINREIDCNSNNITILSRKDTYNMTYISAVIDGVKYDYANVDDLVKQGVIKVSYYLVFNKKLNYDEYISGEYADDYEINIYCNPDTVLNDDSVYGFVCKKVSLPNVNENNIVKIKKYVN